MSYSDKSVPKHLCIRPLTVYDAAQCMALEEEAFPEEERITSAKLDYRLSVCPELCSGLFFREFEPQTESEEGDDDVREYRPPARSTIKKETLIGQILATKVYDDAITERSMEVPKLTSELLPDPTVVDNDKIGHVETSRVIGVHSVIISSKYRGLKLGSLLMKDYIQKLSQQDVGDKIVLIAHDYLVPFYQSLGFENRGESKCRFAGEVWFDLAITLSHDEDDE
ncbi:unnamed protein product [Kuraishia capsulata CBS 1993]|uniref:N-acetyltransferase domain-containing protein n=1 Tax=Kuraishia capsulata CBS 1993 TaxID=1382522 RepID=W6MRM5_9ASCO|nr:uncharacterized protein KUCA_T00005357001 [Kuraishia capsulata CBS 1993]CDK29369.1 unnamed protein product [Kuraishia capsulata CBS 1993]